MADIEDKLLGYRRENYASSSEEEDEDALPAQEFMGLGVGPRVSIAKGLAYMGAPDG